MFCLDDLNNLIDGIKAHNGEMHITMGSGLYNRYFRPLSIRVKRRKGLRTRIVFTGLSLIQKAVLGRK